MKKKHSIAVLQHERQSFLTQIKELKLQLADYRNRMPCSKKERQKIKRQGKVAVIKTLGKPDSSLYKNNYRKVFRNLWADYKGHFGIDTIDETPEIKFTEALHFIDDWKLKEVFQLKIEDVEDGINVHQNKNN